MDLLYVVELDVADPSAVPTGPAGVMGRLVGHVASWLDLSPDRLVGDGSVARAVVWNDTESPREIAWHTVDATEASALVVTTSQPLGGDTGAVFVSETTILREPHGCRFRLAMGRHSGQGLLAPTSVTFLRRPGVLRQVVEDDTLRCTAYGQRVDGRYDWINGRAGDILVEALSSPHRLPFLLVDGADGDAAKRLCSVTARELVGLVQVCPIGSPTLRALAGRLDTAGVRVPPRGATLVWPSHSARHPVFTATQISYPGRAAATMLKLVAPASVAAHGTNGLLRAATDAARADTARELDEALEAATATGDTDAQVAALQAQVRAAADERDFWFEQAETNDQARKQALADVANYRARVDTLLATVKAPHGQSWSDAPDLDANDLGTLARFLEHMTQGALVFTGNAEKSWQASRYPDIEYMSEHLVSLAQAAVAWRDAGGTTGGIPLDQWLKTGYEVNYAHTDKGLRAAGADRFHFDGKEYSREPHLKLDDHTTPNRVGRIYFAIDAPALRFVIDHVGLKLYGL